MAALSLNQLPLTDLSEESIIREVASQDDGVFWSNRISEHQLFYHLGLTEPVLKQRAAENFSAWQQLLQTGGAADALIAATQEFQNEVEARLMRSEPLGFIFPSVANHWNRELNYFIRKLQGPALTDREEWEFWTEILKDHLEIESHLLDPKEADSIIEAARLSQVFAALNASEFNQMAVLSALQRASALESIAQQRQLEGNLLSVIDPRLLLHHRREGARAQLTLSRLNGSRGTSKGCGCGK